MKWAWRLARVRGVDVNVHATFVIFLVWIAFASRARGASVESTLGTLLFTLAVFASVVLHEFGHVTVARRFGVGTKRITLLPIGGVAELERMPERPREEFLVTIAGPAVNVFLGALLLLWLSATGAAVLVPPSGLFGEGNYIARLFWVQVSLVVFNAIPAFPMDGGRVLRAGLSMRVGWVRATKISASVGQVIALVFAFFGLFGNPLLMFIGLFVWIGAQTELMAAETKAAIEGVPSSAAVEHELKFLREHDTLAEAARLLLAGAQRDFPVRSGEALVGVLTRDQLIAGLSSAGANGLVRDAMTREIIAVEAAEPLTAVLDRMRAARAQVAALNDNGTLVGLLTSENIAELILVRRALNNHQTSN